MSNYADKLASLRAALRHFSLDAYIIRISDPHLGENIQDHWQIVNWLTGFSGSSATIVITKSFAGLWTDSRYFLQAEIEITGSGFELAKPALLKQGGYAEWLSENIQPDSRIGLDGHLFSIQEFRSVEKKLLAKNIKISPDYDLISNLWNDRPGITFSNIFDHHIRYSGRERKDKIDDVRRKMKSIGVAYQLLTSPDDIMWLLNIRAGDYRNSPLALSYAIIGPDQVILFADINNFPSDLAASFDSSGIVILPYNEICAIIHKIIKNVTLYLDPERTNVQIYNALPKTALIKEGNSFPALLKSVKNKVEISNILKCMIKDGVALTKFFFWIEGNTGSTPMSEVSLSGRIKDFRSHQDGFICNSFEPIVAFKGHGALPHYRADSNSDYVIGETGILLIDSGGQYVDGTTDITRTIAIGNPSGKQKEDFTLVLKGHIGLSMARFPKGTRGYQLDILARKPLWDKGLNYGHGTGHGVGFCLNVHEGPQNISPADNKTIIEPGMLISNEPAIYREGEYGIRTENLLICREEEETDFGEFLCFETVSLCYLDKKLIIVSLLNEEEINWINSYHSEVYQKLSPYLSENEKEWLFDKTGEIH